MHKNPKRYSAPGNGALPPIGAALPKRGSSRCTCGSLVEGRGAPGAIPWGFYDTKPREAWQSEHGSLWRARQCRLQSGRWDFAAW